MHLNRAITSMAVAAAAILLTPAALLLLLPEAAVAAPVPVPVPNTNPEVVASTNGFLEDWERFLEIIGDHIERMRELDEKTKKNETGAPFINIECVGAGVCNPVTVNRTGTGEEEEQDQGQVDPSAWKKKIEDKIEDKKKEKEKENDWWEEFTKIFRGGKSGRRG